jgi:hypothetical protein
MSMGIYVGLWHTTSEKCLHTVDKAACVTNVASRLTL